MAAICATFSAVTRSRVWARANTDPRVLANIRQMAATRERRMRFGMVESAIELSEGGRGDVRG